MPAHPPICGQPEQRVGQRHRAMQERPLALRQGALDDLRRFSRGRRGKPVHRIRKTGPATGELSGEMPPPSRRSHALAQPGPSRLAQKTEVRPRLIDPPPLARRRRRADPTSSRSSAYSVTRAYPHSGSMAFRWPWNATEGVPGTVLPKRPANITMPIHGRCPVQPVLGPCSSTGQLSATLGTSVPPPPAAGGGGTKAIVGFRVRLARAEARA